MNATATAAKTVDAPSDRVWDAIRSIGGLDRWFPVINSCRVEGRGVGAVWIMDLGDGGEIRDRVIEVDDARHRFRYDRFISPFPVASYIGTVTVRDEGGRSDVVWQVEIEVAPEQKDGLVAFLEKALSDGVDGLERELREARAGAG